MASVNGFVCCRHWKALHIPLHFPAMLMKMVFFRVFLFGWLGFFTLCSLFLDSKVCSRFHPHISLWDQILLLFFITWKSLGLIWEL